MPERGGKFDAFAELLYRCAHLRQPDTVTHDHFLTTSADERDALIKGAPTFQYEGVALQAYVS